MNSSISMNFGEIFNFASILASTVLMKTRNIFEILNIFPRKKRFDSKMQKSSPPAHVAMQLHIVLASNRKRKVSFNVCFVFCWCVFCFCLCFWLFIHFICPIRCLLFVFSPVCVRCCHFHEISAEIMFYYSFHIAIVCSIHLTSNSLNSILFNIIAAVTVAAFIQRHSSR